MRYVSRVTRDVINDMLYHIDNLYYIVNRQENIIMDLQKLSEMHLTRIEALEAEVQRLKEGM